MNDPLFKGTNFLNIELVQHHDMVDIGYKNSLQFLMASIRKLVFDYVFCILKTQRCDRKVIARESNRDFSL